MWDLQQKVSVGADRQIVGALQAIESDLMLRVPPMAIWPQRVRAFLPTCKRPHIDVAGPALDVSGELIAQPNYITTR